MFSALTRQGCVILLTACTSRAHSRLQKGLNAFAADRAPQRIRAEALSLQRQAADCAFLVAPMGLGLLSQVAGSNVAALGLFAATAGGAAGVFMGKTRGIVGSEGVEAEDLEGQSRGARGGESAGPHCTAASKDAGEAGFGSSACAAGQQEQSNPGGKSPATPA